MSSFSFSKPRKAFTLVEILSAISIIAILMGLVIAVQGGVTDKQDITRAQAEITRIASALEQYRARHGSFPYDEGGKGIEVVVRALTGVTGPTGREFRDKDKSYIDLGDFAADDYENPRAIYDPWGEPYQYEYKNNPSDTSWQTPSFVLWSHGPDMQSDEPLDDGIIDNDYGNDSVQYPHDIDNIVYSRF